MRLGLMVAVAVTACAVATAGAAPKARISMQSARKAALSYVPHGAVSSGELETEHGRLIYSFDIAVAGRPGVEEVQISAIDGSLVSRRHESPAAESREAKSEKTMHKAR